MRYRKVVAGVALIATLASVAVPGVVGSQPPSPAAPIDEALFQSVNVASITGSASTTPTLDPAVRAAGTQDAASVVIDPAEPPVEAGRPNGPKIQPSSPTRSVLKPKPKPRPAPVVTSRAPSSSGSSGSSSGGSWRRDPEVSWYGPGFYGKRTACGQAYTTTIMGVAHRSLPCGTRVTFRNPSNGRTFTVPVIDRGPYVAGRQWDLSGALCTALDHCYTGPILWRFP